MVEIAPRTTGDKCRHRLEELPAEPNDVRSGTQRDPVQIDSYLVIYCRFQVAHTCLNVVYVRARTSTVNGAAVASQFDVILRQATSGSSMRPCSSHP